MGQCDMRPEGAFGTTGVKEQTQRDTEELSERAICLATEVSPFSPTHDTSVCHTYYTVCKGMQTSVSAHRKHSRKDTNPVIT